MNGTDGTNNGAVPAPNGEAPGGRGSNRAEPFLSPPRGPMNSLPGHGEMQPSQRGHHPIPGRDRPIIESPFPVRWREGAE